MTLAVVFNRALVTLCLVLALVGCATAVGGDDASTCLATDVMGRCINGPLYFSRTDAHSDIHKHLAVRVHSYSTSAVTMTVMLLFRSPLALAKHQQLTANSSGSGTSDNGNRQMTNAPPPPAHHRRHNALSVGSQLYPYFHPVTQQSRMSYANLMPLVAKSRHFSLSYDLVADTTVWNRLTQTTNVQSTLGAVLQATGPMAILGASIFSPLSLVTYHALLALDGQSAVWNHYNVLLVTPYEVSLRYVVGGRLDTAVGVYDYVSRLNCRRHNHASDDNCRIDVNTLTLGDQSTYVTAARGGYRLIIDLHSSRNYLPVDLFYRLQALPKHKQTLRFELNASTGGERLETVMEQSATSHVLLLNSRFTYEINGHDSDIIIGVDLLHYFPQVAYSNERRELHLWYTAQSYANSAQYDAVAITLSFLLLVVLYCHYDLMSCDNRRLYHFLVRVSHVSFRWFFFNVRQVLIEFIMLLVSLIVLLLTLSFADYNTSNQMQRNMLFWILLVYHWVILVVIIAASPEIIRQAFIQFAGLDLKIHDRTGVQTASPPQQQQQQPPQQQQQQLTQRPRYDIHSRDYFGTNRPSYPLTRPRQEASVAVDFGAGVGTTTTAASSEKGATTDEPTVKDEDFRPLAKEYIETDENRLSKQYMSSIMARHTVILLIIMLSLMLIVNFEAQASFLMLAVLVILSLLFLREFIYHLFICYLYALGRPDDVKLPLRFVFFLAGETLCLALYVAWSIPCLYVDFANAYNSVYSPELVVATAIILVALMFVLVCQRITTHMDTIVRKHYIHV